MIFSCVQSSYRPPYVISSLECVCGEVENFFMYAGVFAQLYNTSEKEIVSLKISFEIYDSATNKNPFLGSNHITTLYEQLLYPSEITELCINLDSHIYEIPSEPFIIKNFCINTITYMDGSTWTDFLCCYGVDSE